MCCFVPPIGESMVVVAAACFISFHEDGFMIGVCIVWSIKRRHHSLLHVVSSIGGIRHQRGEREPTQSVKKYTFLHV